MGKIKKRIFFIILTVVLVLAVAIVGIGYNGQKQQSDKESREEIVLEDGQYLRYARIDSIAGNELNYTVMEEQTADSDLAQNPQRKQSCQRSENPQGEQTGQRPEFPQGEDSQRPEFPQGEDSQRPEMPQGDQTSQRPEMPQGDQTSQRTEMPQGEQTESMPQNAQKSQEERSVSYVATTKTGQLQIPVGTEVITKLGTSTTFSRLSNGDVISMVLQKDDRGNEVVMKIRIVG